jgi:hypothetical protein
MDKLINIYKINIYERYKDLLNSGKTEFNNTELWKIFEWYSCINLMERDKSSYYLHEDIEPDFKELNRMSKNDTGIDFSNLIDTIGQCKLRQKLTYS